MERAIIVKSKYLALAKEELKKDVDNFPNQFNLLVIITDAYRSRGDHEKSLEYAELLITHHPDKFEGYGRAAQDLVALNKFKEAQKTIQLGLKKFPNQFALLKIATYCYRSSGDHEKTLEYAELMITHHPDKFEGYEFAIHEAIISQKLNKARLIAEKGIAKFNNDECFFAILSDIAFAQGDEKMHDKYERLIAQKVFFEDIYERQNITPKSIKSELKVSGKPPLLDMMVAHP